VDEVASIIGSQRRSVYYWMHRYLDHHRVADFYDASQAGRPRIAAQITKARILRELARSAETRLQQDHLDGALVGVPFESALRRSNRSADAPVRACWALRGAQTVVPITGRNAKRTLFSMLNTRTEHLFKELLAQTFVKKVLATYLVAHPPSSPRFLVSPFAGLYLKPKALARFQN